jgi:site-specific DNA-methyltransferase (adenine-specific)
MELMARYPDNYFDLAIVDPPYGIGIHKAQGTTKAKPKKWIGGDWDNQVPSDEYWLELFRVSKNQIVWGANYFIKHLDAGKKWLVWDKKLDQDQSHFELAWTSFVGAERIYRSSRSKLQGFMNPNRFHPTEKPIDLYRWLLMNYAKENDKILDTHLGSGSIAIACHNLKFDLTACELDKDYFDASLKRLHNHQSQLTMF